MVRRLLNGIELFNAEVSRRALVRSYCYDNGGKKQRWHTDLITGHLPHSHLPRTNPNFRPM